MFSNQSLQRSYETPLPILLMIIILRIIITPRHGSLRLNLDLNFSINVNNAPLKGNLIIVIRIQQVNNHRSLRATLTLGRTTLLPPRSRLDRRRSGRQIIRQPRLLPTRRGKYLLIILLVVKHRFSFARSSFLRRRFGRSVRPATAVDFVSELSRSFVDWSHAALDRVVGCAVAKVDCDFFVVWTKFGVGG
ncbi:hypothetical protein ABW19_dt0208093 [Dactylella cylindrospora]|nr:hypothetical protein ABW19_dt0208093 [Dactylella cylindrospora]